MVPAHDKDASEIIIATVTVDHDSEYHFTLCLRSICSRSPAQLEARSTSLVDTFSSRAELRGLSRFPPSSCRARAHISTYVTQHVILSVIGREPDSRPSCSHVCNFNGTRQSIALVGSARRRARARACHWRFSVPSPRETTHVITRAHAHDTTTETTTTITPNFRIAITMVPTNSACCPSQTPSPSSLRARDHRYEADETQ